MPSAKESPSTQGYTPFEGLELSARVDATFLRGHKIYAGGQVIGAPIGRYLHRPTATDPSLAPPGGDAMKSSLLGPGYTDEEIEATLASLEAHPSIEVRLYNPFPRGKSRALAWLTDFARLNKRMHNKSFTADRQVTIVGGRNVGNEYYGAAKDKADGEGRVSFERLQQVASGAADAGSSTAAMTAKVISEKSSSEPRRRRNSPHGPGCKAIIGEPCETKSVGRGAAMRALQQPSSRAAFGCFVGGIRPDCVGVTALVYRAGHE